MEKKSKLLLVGVVFERPHVGSNEQIRVCQSQNTPAQTAAFQALAHSAESGPGHLFDTSSAIR